MGSLEPGRCGLALLRQREHALGRNVVDDVELVVELRDHALVRRTGIDIREVLGPWLAEAPEARPLPVVAQLPNVPFAVGIEAVQRVRAQCDGLVEVELQRVLDLVEDVLGQDPDSGPPHREIGVEPGVRLLQLEDDGIGIGRLDGGDVVRQHRAKAHRRILDLDIHRGFHVVGRELHTVAPVEPLAQLRGHLREVGVVDWLFRRKRIVPDPVKAGFGVDVPEGIEPDLLKAIGL